MSGEKNHRVRCLRCRKHRDEVGPISWGGNCAACGDASALGNNADLRAHSGEWFIHWRKRTLAAFGVTLDEASTRE